MVRYMGRSQFGSLVLYHVSLSHVDPVPEHLPKPVLATVMTPFDSNEFRVSCGHVN